MAAPGSHFFRIKQGAPPGAFSLHAASGVQPKPLALFHAQTGVRLMRSRNQPPPRRFTPSPAAPALRQRRGFKWRPIMARKLLTLFAITTSLALSACNTVKGVGEDVQSVGEAGDKAI
jgi:entericidin B